MQKRSFSRHFDRVSTYILQHFPQTNTPFSRTVSMWIRNMKMRRENVFFIFFGKSLEMYGEL